MFGSFSRKRAPAVAVDNKHLRKLVQHNMGRHGKCCDLNHIDVSNVQDFTGIFANTDFNGDVSKWNMSNARSLQELFASCPFNGDISQWDVSNVIDLSRTFFKSSFQGDISRWNVSRVSSMHSTFAHSQFNGDISQWDVSSVATMSAMFMASVFTQSLSEWDVSNVTDMSMMFHGSLFGGDISQWDLSSLKHATHVFDSAYFTSDLPPFDVDKLLTGSSMLSAAFRGRLGGDVGDYANIRKMFPNSIATSNYLGYMYKIAGPAPMHIDYALQHAECPSWFNPALFDWVKEEQAMCAKMGFNANTTRSLVTDNFLHGSTTDTRADSIPFEFDAARSTVI